MENENERKLVHDSNSVMEVSIISVIGDRDDQQDAFRYVLKENEGMVVVCDGMGGHEGGQRAAEMAAEQFAMNYEDSDPSEEPCEGMTKSAYSCDALVSDLKREDGEPLKAGTTCVAVLVRDKCINWCSVGDSRAYLLRGDEFVQLTLDQNYMTVLKEKLKLGMISAEEFRAEEEKGDALISFLGIGNLSLIDYNSEPFPLESGDLIVIMSDGLYRVLNDDDMRRLICEIRNPEEVVSALDEKRDSVAQINDIERDNMTVAIMAIK